MQIGQVFGLVTGVVVTGVAVVLGLCESSSVVVVTVFVVVGLCRGGGGVALPSNFFGGVLREGESLQQLPFLVCSGEGDRGFRLLNCSGLYLYILEINTFIH